ncbi:MAG: ABC transporter permease [Deltaproteobacteria bacterium]|nr:ABC transporter permease [Deltaproteobacteria bacterium]
MKHLAIRFLQMLLILAVLSVFLFWLMLQMPGNPVDLLITSNPRIKAEDVIRLKKLKGLDKPWYVQYVRWMWGYYEPTRAPDIDPLDPALDSRPTGEEVHFLFNDKVSGGRKWFVIKNQAGLESVGTLWIDDAPPTQLAVQPIESQAIEKPETFSVNLSKFVTGDTKGLRFKLIGGSPGEVDNQGIYRWLEQAIGQRVVQFEVYNKAGDKALGAFSVEQDPIPNKKIFNKGFIFIFTGDTEAMGFSNTYKRPVWTLLKSRVANTLWLMFPAILLSLLIALPLGVLSAYRQHSWIDYLLNFLAFVGISLPVFWFGIMMMFWFAEKLQWFPAGGIESPGIWRQGYWDIFVDRLSHAVLPVIVLSIAYAGRWLRYMRASMLEILPADYIRTARAKGLSERIVLLKHALRNALIPVVTVLALSVPALFGGAVLTETVFAWPGIGRLQYDAVMNSDYYVAIVVFLISALLVMLGNLLADWLYIIIDPRVRKS